MNKSNFANQGGLRQPATYTCRHRTPPKQSNQTAENRAVTGDGYLFVLDMKRLFIADLLSTEQCHSFGPRIYAAGPYDRKSAVVLHAQLCFMAVNFGTNGTGCFPAGTIRPHSKMPTEKRTSGDCPPRIRTGLFGWLDTLESGMFTYQQPSQVPNGLRLEFYFSASAERPDWKVLEPDLCKT
jgi:hypothetical protein